MAEWLNRSYQLIGKYFDCSDINDYYDKLKLLGNNWVHIHSMYSTFDSTQTTDEICQTAVEKGCKNVTLTDHGTLLGIESFMESGKKYGVNTIPGVETYRENRCHMLLFARNYKGYVGISHAMREANTNIVKVKGTKLENAIMTKEICETFFKGNENVIATTACIQGTVGYILLANHRLKKPIKKFEEKVNELEESYKVYEANSKLLKESKEMLSSKKKELTSFNKYLKPNFIKKVDDNRLKLEGMEITNKNYEKLSEDVATKTKQIETAKEAAKILENEIELLNKTISSYKTITSEVKKDADNYLKALAKVNEVVYFDEDVLYEEAKKELYWYKNTFPLFFIEIQYHGLQDEAYVMPKLVKLARELEIPLIAANDAHMKDNSEESIEARRIVRYNYFNKTQDVDDSDKELYLKTDEELSKSLLQVVDKDACYEALFNTRILETCNVIFPSGEHYPSVNSNVDFMDMLIKGKERCLSNGIIDEWTSEYDERLNHEVKIISDMGYIDYHKVVEDFCREARLLGSIPRNEICNIPDDYSQIHKWIEEKKFGHGVGVGLGRGSGVGSLVCCLLGITNLDPIKYNLLFERFLNPERVSMPDIDTDIATRLRPTIIKYLKWKYGEKAVCSIATETTYGAKGAIQMAGRDRASQKYINLPKKAYDEACKSYLHKYTSPLSDVVPEIPNITIKDCEEELKILTEEDKEFEIILEHAKLLEGKLKGTGIHAGGIIISDNDNVNDYIPLAYNSEMDVWVAQCNMTVAEKKGLLKMDLLGVSTLDCISECIYLVNKYKGIDIDINKIRFEREVFDEIYSKGCTNSVFQFESDGMKDMLRQFKPTCFEDIILLVACYRPGPMQYLENIIKVKNKELPLAYKTPELESILSATYGAVVYQEQVMQIFQKLAGYSLGGADLVRRAMSKKKAEVLEKERDAFINGDIERNIDGCVKRGIKKDIANELFNEMVEFAKYAFNKSHAAAYAYVSYQTAWLKHHYPNEFLCAMFNNESQDKFKPLIDDCDLYNISLLQPDINKSYYDFVLENNCIRYGIAGIKGIGEANIDAVNNICRNRENGIYESFENFSKRCIFADDNEINKNYISKKMLIIFANAGLFDSFGYNRQELATSIEKLDKISEALVSIKEDDILKGTNTYYNLAKEIELLGTIISIKPLEGYASDEVYKCKPINTLTEGENACIFGFVSGIIEKNNKYGDLIYVMEIIGKDGSKIYVHTDKNLHNRYKIYELIYKVIKCQGKCMYERLFIKDLSFLNPNVFDYYLELKTAEETNLVSALLNKEREELSEDICVRILCHWVLRNGQLVQTERPKIAERWFSYKEINYLEKNNIVFTKWDIK